MRDFRPFLQIVHVAAMHLVSPASPLPRRARALARMRAAADRGDVWPAEPAPHDPLALLAFEDLLAALSVEDPVFRRLPTWLLDTGDRALFADDAALALGREAVRAWALRALLRGRVELHGVRDARPALPGVAAPAEHHARLARHWYPHRWPAPPLSERAPTGRLEVQLYALDTVSPTGSAPAALAPDALARLAASVSQHRPGGDVRALRIVASHHPLAALPPGALQTAPPDNPPDKVFELPPDARPLAHLHLAGPAPASPALASAGTTALGVGSLLARPGPGAGELYAQQCQVLRVYYSPSRPRVVVIERLFCARAAGIGPYRVVPRADGEPAEELALEV
jgi:hypothetical protein